MNGDEFITLLGKPYTDEKVQAFLAAGGIQKQPKLPRGDMDAYLENKKNGLEIVFRDERYLDVKSEEYEEGALVLWSITMYGDDETFKRFEGNLPLGLKFNFGLKETKAKI